VEMRDDAQWRSCRYAVVKREVVVTSAVCRVKESIILKGVVSEL
jgi:hypothetical protein